jgi:hypothetical protein
MLTGQVVGVAVRRGLREQHRELVPLLNLAIADSDCVRRLKGRQSNKSCLSHKCVHNTIFKSTSQAWSREKSEIWQTDSQNMTNRMRKIVGWSQSRESFLAQRKKKDGLWLLSVTDFFFLAECGLRLRAEFIQVVVDQSSL